MLTKFKGICASLALLCCVATADAQQIAFPGAAGWGRFAQGARKSSSPTVYHVTNLNDSGTGSLRDAVSVSNRIVVFDVSGVINITSRLVFKSNLYVAGQTAPGEGVTVYGNGVSFSGSDNIICRYMRFRMGHNGDSGKDCAGVANGYNMMFDHCSFSWGLDETFSINAFGLAGNITLSNCIIGQGLMTHSAGGLMQADSITLYRNLYIDNSTRNNKIKGINQYANNVVYNWKNGCYIMGGESDGESFCNIQSNLFINGPANGGNALGGGNSNFHFYGNDNWQDKDMNGVFAPVCIDESQTGGGDKQAEPYDYPELELYPGNELIEKNIPTVGASLPYRDQSDCYMIDELMSFGKSGALISNEENLPIGSPSTWAWYTGVKKTDTDGDGMPDGWEVDNGTDPTKDDACVKADNGYLNIENYINSITVDDRDYFLRAPITLSQSAKTTSTITASWRDYTYEEDGFAIEIQEDGSSDAYKEVGRTSANATKYVITGLKDGVYYNVRVRAFAKPEGEKEEKYSDYATCKMNTNPIEKGIVDIDTYQPDLTVKGNGIWNKANTALWNEGRAFVNGDKVLVNNTVARVIMVNDTVAPGCVVVNNAAAVSLSGSKPIIGDTCSLNKAGEGTLTITSTVNTFAGGVVNHGGTIAFASVANGGKASSLGAAPAFAQNWIFDGGTYQYTGASAKTDRSAQIKSSGTLKVSKNASTTLTMSGTFEGTGDLTIDGPGTVSVSNTAFFSYTGATRIVGGNLYLSTVDVAKAGIGKSSKIVLAGGKLSTKGESESYETYKFPIEVEEGTYSYFAPNRNCYTKNTITGAGTFEYSIPYLREYWDPDITGFTGQIVANGVGTDSWGSLFMSEGSFNMPTTRVYLKGNAKMCMWTTVGNGYIGGLSGDAGTYLMASSKTTDGTTCSWTIGGSNSDETFNGIINNSCCASGHTAGSNNITKIGTGLWRLTGKNPYIGLTTVNGGSLIVNGTNSGSGKYVVNAGATLKGTGSLSGAGTVTVNSGGTLAAGDTIVASKTFTIAGAVTMKKGSTLSVPVANTTLMAYKQNNFNLTSLTLEDSVTLEIDRTSVQVALEKDTCFTIFATIPTTLKGTFTTISPATPGAGLKWDASQLYTTGKLYIREDAKKGDVNGDGSVNISDVNAVISVMCGDETYEATADVNGDGSVNISDVNAVITIMCGAE